MIKELVLAIVVSRSLEQSEGAAWESIGNYPPALLRHGVYTERSECVPRNGLM
jgi:ribosomal protein S16